MSAPIMVTPSPSTLRERSNWQIHQLYVKQLFPACLKLIEEQLQACGGTCEYAIYVKGLILRQQGKIQESLALFQAATCLSPHNVQNLKQVGRSLYLLGKHRAAIEVYEEAQKIAKHDWELAHNKGVCFTYLKQYKEALEALDHANSLHRHDATTMQMGKVYQLQQDYKSALDVFREALEFSPENPELLTTIGLIYLRLGENQLAFDYLGNSLTHDPRNAKTILAAGSIIQNNQDMDVALVKYRVAAIQTPNSAHLWNNIGMCFFGKGRYVAAVACLKRAQYLDPFEWIIGYNLGLVHLTTGQYASAFHYLSASINLKHDFAPSYMYLAIALARLEDFENACSAYEQAIKLEGPSGDYLTHLNYALTLYLNDELEKAATHFNIHTQLFELNGDEEEQDEEFVTQRDMLHALLQKAGVLDQRPAAK